MTNDFSDAELETLLDNRRRRYVLYCLFRYVTPMSLPTVADRVTELEYGAPAETLLDERLRVYMSLYHEHIPLLAEAGFVDYHQEDDSVDLAENALAIKSRVAYEASHEFGEQWPQILTECE